MGFAAKYTYKIISAYDRNVGYLVIRIATENINKLKSHKLLERLNSPLEGAVPIETPFIEFIQYEISVH